MNTNMRITAECCPSIPRAEIVRKSKYRYKIDDLSTLGSGFAIVANELSNTAKHAPVKFYTGASSRKALRVIWLNSKMARDISVRL